jgi:hypothetical protein
VTGDPFTVLLAGIVLVLWLLIGIAAILCTVSQAVLRRRRGDDIEALIEATREDLIEALIEATREDMPDHVPAEWTEELS